jgi:Fe-S cluster biogenesis protein NfuA
MTITQESLYSKRVEQRLSAPKFRLQKKSETDQFTPANSVIVSFKIPESNGLVRLFISLNEKDLTLSKMGYATNISGAEIAYLEAFCELSLGKSRQGLAKFSFREVENFLRDQNHLPAYPYTADDEAIWNLLNQRTIKALSEHSMMQKSSEVVVSKWHPQLSLSEKYQAIETVLEHFVRPALKEDQGNLLFIAAEETGTDLSIWVRFQGNCESCPSSLTGTLQFIEETLIKELQHTQLKVVAKP